MKLYYTASYKPASTMTYQGPRGTVNELVERYGLKIIDDRNGWWLLGTPMQSQIYEIDADTGTTLRQCNPRNFIMSRNPSFVNLTQKRVNTLVVELNAGRVSFDDVYAMRWSELNVTSSYLEKCKMGVNGFVTPFLFG